MSIPVRTGRACGSRNCRWCGPEAETVVYEVRDNGKLGDEVMCLVCGKHQYRWGESTCARQAGEYAEKDRQWRRDVHIEFLLDVAFWVWIAGQIIQLGGQAPAEAEQLGLFGAVSA